MCRGDAGGGFVDRVGIELRSGEVAAEGDLDFRGTLGVDSGCPGGVPVGRLTFDLDSDASQEEVDKLIALTERYCVSIRRSWAAPRWRSRTPASRTDPEPA